MSTRHITKYKNGNSLSYAEYGDKKGYPIIVQHGLIASIDDYHLFDRLIKSGTRLICVARPGYGESSPYGMRNLAEWGEIVSFLVAELEIVQFDILGMSSGAPYGYAIAHRIPGRVRAIFIFSGTPALYDERVLALWPYPVDRHAGIPELQKLAKEIFFSNASQEDLQRNAIRDSTRYNCFGIAQDLHLRCRDWGFNLSDVKAKVFMQHGLQDEQVPFRTAEITAQLLTDCRLEIRKEGGHFTEKLLDDFINKTMLRQRPRRQAGE
jgi:pimeloyl-ACP methyl ester carboxylesterase